MRYQRVSPDHSFPQVNGRKSNSRSTSDDDASSSGYTAIAISRSTFTTQSEHQHHHSPGDVLLQWGQKKRSRISRTEIRPSVQNKVRRRAPALSADKPSTAAVPPPLATRTGKESLGHGILPNRNLEEQGNGSASRNGHGVYSSRSAAAKRSIVKSNGSLQNHSDDMNGSSHPKRQSSAAKIKNFAPPPPPVKVLQCPRIYLSLSKKEKEEDFVAMKGTKLPHRPKKRLKSIDKSLQYCYPGMWLSELTRSRYEVREKKSVNKQQQKKRGLKGMESLDNSDSY